MAIREKAPKSLDRQVYDRYRKAIVDGNVCAGQCVPALERWRWIYDDPIGLKGLREATAAHLRTGRQVRSEAQQIMIVSGPSVVRR
jgi:hypothetical protein